MRNVTRAESVRRRKYKERVETLKSDVDSVVAQGLGSQVAFAVLQNGIDTMAREIEEIEAPARNIRGGVSCLVGVCVWGGNGGGGGVCVFGWTASRSKKIVALLPRVVV